MLQGKRKYHFQSVRSHLHGVEADVLRHSRPSEYNKHTLPDGGLLQCQQLPTGIVKCSYIYVVLAAQLFSVMLGNKKCIFLVAESEFNCRWEKV